MIDKPRNPETEKRQRIREACKNIRTVKTPQEETGPNERHNGDRQNTTETDRIQRRQTEYKGDRQNTKETRR